MNTTGTKAIDTGDDLCEANSSNDSPSERTPEATKTAAEDDRQKRRHKLDEEYRELYEKAQAALQIHTCSETLFIERLMLVLQQTALYIDALEAANRDGRSP